MQKNAVLKHHLILKLGIIITCLTITSEVWAELPFVRRYNVLNTKLTKQYKEEAFQGLLLTIDEIKKTGLPRTDAMLYYEGVALLHTGNKNKAKSKLEDYLHKAGRRGNYYREATKLLAIRQAVEKRNTATADMKFVYISPGTYAMGSPKHEKERDADEKQHQVALSEGFYLQTTEVTQGQWRAIMGNTPARFNKCGNDCPVENVSWYDAQKFINKLNQRERTNRYRLPTEAEWEYACRAGNTGKFGYGDNESKLGEYAWYKNNSAKRTHRVAKKKPNAWGLYDMHGNVWEWCQDWYEKDPASATDQAGPPDSGAYRVNRGGSWGIASDGVRCADRANFLPGIRYSGIGFRLVKMP